MPILLAAVRKGGAEAEPARLLSRAAGFYLERIEKYESARAVHFASEEALLSAIEKLRGRTAPIVAFLDRAGKSVSSEELAAWIRRHRDIGVQNIVFAVGPADGWSTAALSKEKAEAAAGGDSLAKRRASERENGKYENCSEKERTSAYGKAVHRGS